METDRKNLLDLFEKGYAPKKFQTERSLYEFMRSQWGFKTSFSLEYSREIVWYYANGFRSPYLSRSKILAAFFVLKRPSNYIQCLEIATEYGFPPEIANKGTIYQVMPKVLKHYKGKKFDWSIPKEYRKVGGYSLMKKRPNGAVLAEKFLEKEVYEKGEYKKELPSGAYTVAPHYFAKDKLFTLPAIERFEIV